MRILVCTSDYPSNREPNRGVFVYNLIQEFVKLGHEVTVIVPTPVHRMSSVKEEEISYGEELAKVFRPVTLSTSAVKLGKFNTYRIGEYFSIYAIRHAVRTHRIEFDMVYAHFLTNGILATRALKHYQKPIFSALGESNLKDRLALINPGMLYKNLHHMRGFVVVAQHLKEHLETMGVPGSRIGVFPNAVDLKKFKKLNQNAIREKLNLDQHAKIVVFVGRMVPHKGPDRLISALKKIDKDIKLILIGRGDLDLEYKGIVFKGALPSRDVPMYLNAADLFVLPTLREGSSNAIVEAMACGLPVISSNIPEVREQCSPLFSKLVDPLNIDSLAFAIESVLFDDKKLEEMAAEAEKYSKKFDIKHRALSIENYLLSKCCSLKKAR